MILTGPEIRRQHAAGKITLEPFSLEQVNPNSYNYRLGPTLRRFTGLNDAQEPVFETIRIPDDGYVLEPGRMTLGHTAEVIGSSSFAMSLIGRSSIGRLGLFLQVSADLGHTTSVHQWTLELVAAKPIRIYAGMRIGQVSFWVNEGRIRKYKGFYGTQNAPTPSRLHAQHDGRGVSPPPGHVQRAAASTFRPSACRPLRA